MGAGPILSRVRGLGEFEDTGRCLSTRAGLSLLQISYHLFFKFFFNINILKKFKNNLI